MSTKYTSFKEDDGPRISSSNRSSDAFGKDLPTFQVEIHDLKDLNTAKELNPMLQMPNISGSDYVAVDELEDGSDRGQGRLMENVTTSLGLVYVSGCTFGFLYAMSTYGLSLYRSRFTLPFRVRVTAVINNTSRMVTRSASVGAGVILACLVAKNSLQYIRGGKVDDVNLVGGCIAAGTFMNLGAGWRVALTRGLLVGPIGMWIMLLGSELSQDESTKAKVVDTWKALRLGSIIGAQTVSEEIELETSGPMKKYKTSEKF